MPNQKQMVSSWLILVLIDRNMVKGMIQGYYENKAESQAALEHIAKREC